jgi:hypothetical protein
MSRRLIFCEGPDDLNALRAVAQLLRWATPATGGQAGAGQERVVVLQAGTARVEIKVPSKSRGATGEGKSALARAVAEALLELPSQIGPPDESHLSLLGVVFDPDDEQAGGFHAEIERTVHEHARAWTLAGGGAPGLWRAQREAGEEVLVRAVDWRAPGDVLDGLPDHRNLERLLCAVLAKAYPDDVAEVARWLDEIGAARGRARRKPATWKAAIHVWLAAVYDKADELNAASRFLHQQAECKPYVEATLADVGLVADLRPLLAPP